MSIRRVTGDVSVSGGSIRVDPVPAAVDAFSRQRVGLPKLRYSAIFDTDKRPELWAESITGSGTATHFPNQRCVDMVLVGTSDNIIRQSKEYFVYRAGQSQLIFCTFAQTTTNANEFLEVGYFDDNDGIFLRNNNGLSFVLRSSTSGSPVETTVAQASWNIDPLDGTGPSGITLDITKTQILVIDFQWLGVGRVRIGFDINGDIFYCHQFLNANTNQTTVYMKTPKLPIRYQARSTGALSGAFLRQICSTVIREGADDEPSVAHEARTNADITVGTAYETVLGIRLKSSNIRATIRMTEGEVFARTNVEFEFAVVLNPALGAAATWKSVESDSVAEFSRTNTTVTVDGDGDISVGHVYPLGGFVSGSSGSSASTPSTNTITETLALAADIAGNSDEIWLVARCISAASGDLRGLLSWNEER